MEKNSIPEARSALILWANDDASRNPRDGVPGASEGMWCAANLRLLCQGM